jgi:predicted O-methyltransferase YrrM
MLTRSPGVRNVLEFRTSFSISTIYLATGLHERSGFGRNSLYNL